MIFKLFIWIFIGLLDFKALNASFSAECPVSYLDDFVGRISKHRDWDPERHDHHDNDFHISNCLELLAYYQSIGVDPQFWCSNSDNFQACCLTCKNYQQLVSPDECVDVAFKQDCEVKKQQGLCDMILGNNQRVHSFCARTCDHCPQDSPYLSCRNLRPNHCQMGGKCLDVTLYNIPTVKCLCPPTRGGTYCQLENPCNSSPCKNGGTCTPSYNDSSSNGGTCSYTCKCPKGFTGSQCEIPNQCFSLYCLNGGYCRLNYVGVPYCVCPDGYYGAYCEKSIGSCNPNPCQNNGICQPTSNNDFKCICPPNYSGKTCNFYVPPTVCYRGDMDASKCMAWKSANLCDFIYVYQTVPIPLYCPISCGLCKDYPSCVDTNPNCPTWANFGLCDFLKQNYPGMCRLSCNCCSNSS